MPSVVTRAAQAKAPPQAAPQISARQGPRPQDAGISILLPIAAIDPNPWDPRRNPRLFPARPSPEDLSLVASIARHGVQENLVVRPAAADRYQLIFGERRLLCAIAAGHTEVPVVVRPLDDHQVRVLTLTESLSRGQLSFLEEADAVSGLVYEGWTPEQVAAELGRPFSWVARRLRLRNLTPAWRTLAEKREGWTASWSAADFAQIAILEPEAQDDLLLAGNRRRLERCATFRELARFIRSLTPSVSGFPWNPDDAGLDPLAGACSACPSRSSRHPSIFDDGQDSEEPLGPPARRSGQSNRAADRCLDPVCAARKARLFVERKVAALAAKHPRVHLLQEGWPPPVLPGALRDWEVTEVEQGTSGAEPAVIANGAGLGKVRWIEPPGTRRQGDPAPPLPAPASAHTSFPPHPDGD